MIRLMLAMSLLLATTACSQKTTNEVKNTTEEIVLPVNEVKADSEDRSQLTLTLGELKTIKMGSNIGTGYSWLLRDELDESLVELVKSEYKEDFDHPDFEGFDHFTFKGLKKGKTTAVFWYVRPWEKNKKEDSKIKIKTYDMVVK